MNDAEIDLAQLCLDRAGLEEIHLDEFAEFVGDTVLIALDDRGVRDRQAKRPLEQRHHRIPVGEPADGGGFGKSRDEAERGMDVAAAAFATTNSVSVPASTSVASALTRRSSAARAASAAREGRIGRSELHDQLRIIVSLQQ